MFGKLNLVSPDLPNALSVEVQIFTERMEEKEDIIVREEDREMEFLKGNGINIKSTTGFLFCPRCGLRKAKDGGSKYCPNCGIKMIEEGSLPYVPKSPRDKKDAHKNILKEGNAMNRSDSIYGLMQEHQFNKSKNGSRNISAIDKADSGEYKNAINEFTEAIRINPNDAGSYFARATLKVRIGDIEGARQDFIMCENCHRNSNFKDYPIV